MITPREALPMSWTDMLVGWSPIGVGMDIGTTTKKKSNPSSIVVTQRQSPMCVERLVLRWKTSDGRISKELLRLVIRDIMATGRRVKAAALDATSEIFFCQEAERLLAGLCPVLLVKASENVEFRGIKGIAKVVVGNIYCSAYEDNLLATPRAEWISKDRRLVKRAGGTFDTDVGENGEHGDTFSAGSLALWALESGGGNVEAAAVGIGGSAEPEPEFEKPFSRHFAGAQIHLHF